MNSRENKYPRLTTWLFCLAGIVLVASCATGGVKAEEENVSNYLYVQTGTNEHWCIVNANGNVTTNRVYPPEAQMSRVYGGDCYWVKAHGRLKLYSVSSPSAPVSMNAYDTATDFCGGLAFTSMRGKPIQMIDTRGKVMATLGKDITTVHSFHDGLARFRQKTAEGELLYGYLDGQGDIAIQAAYRNAGDFHDGVAVVRRSAESDYLIIDTNGGVIGKLDKQNGYYYDIGLADYYTITANKEGNGTKTADKNWKGQPENNVYDTKTSLGNGFVAVRKGGKYGVMDTDGKVVIPPAYDACLPFMVGDKFILKQDSVFILAGKDGKRAGNTAFTNVGNMRMGPARTMR